MKKLLISIGVFCLSLFFSTSVFAADTLTSNTNLVEPVMLSKQVVSVLYNYDYQTAQSQLKRASRYFTGPAWTHFKTALDASKNLEAMKEKKLTLSGKIAGPLSATQQTDSVVVKFPMDITIKNNESANTQSVNITMTMVDISNHWKVSELNAVPRAKED